MCMTRLTHTSIDCIGSKVQPQRHDHQLSDINYSFIFNITISANKHHIHLCHQHRLKKCSQFKEKNKMKKIGNKLDCNAIGIVLERVILASAIASVARDDEVQTVLYCVLDVEVRAESTPQLLDDGIRVLAHEAREG